VNKLKNKSFITKYYLEKNLPPDIDKQIRNVLSRAFPDVKIFQHRRWTNTQPLEKDIWFVTLINSKVIAVTWLHNREISNFKRNLFIGGIGNVCSLPEYRGFGAAKLCMLEAQEYLIESQKFDYGLLFCGPQVSGFYLKLGWIEVNNTFYFTNQNNEKDKDDSCIKMIYPAKMSVSEWRDSDFDINGNEW